MRRVSEMKGQNTCGLSSGLVKAGISEQGFLKPQCSIPPPPQRGRAEACTCFSGMCALHQRRLSTEPIIELVDNESLKPCVVLSSLFAVKRLLWKPCGLVWWLA
ncbi:hypothetical protein PO909_007950 [Leuciscus waleckii]